MQKVSNFFFPKWPLRKHFWDSILHLGHSKAYLLCTEPSLTRLLYPFSLLFLSTFYHPIKTRHQSFPDASSLGFSFSSPSPSFHPLLSHHAVSDSEHGMENFINFFRLGESSVASYCVGCVFPAPPHPRLLSLICSEIQRHENVFFL